MRTTLDLDDDVLASAKEIARREKKTAGQVVSELARRALQGQLGAGGGSAALTAPPPLAAYGFEPFAARGQVVSDALVQTLRDDGEY